METAIKEIRENIYAVTTGKKAIKCIGSGWFEAWPTAAASYIIVSIGDRRS